MGNVKEVEVATDEESIEIETMDTITSVTGIQTMASTVRHGIERRG